MTMPDLGDFSSVEFLQTVREKMWKFQQQGTYCDVSICVKDGRVISGHKLVLACHSQVFHKQFNLETADSVTQLNFPNVAYENMMNLMQFMYNGILLLDDIDLVSEMHSLVTELEIVSAVHLCDLLLKSGPKCTLSILEDSTDDKSTKEVSNCKSGNGNNEARGVISEIEIFPDDFQVSPSELKISNQDHIEEKKATNSYASESLTSIFSEDNDAQCDNGELLDQKDMTTLSETMNNEENQGEHKRSQKLKPRRCLRDVEQSTKNIDYIKNRKRAATTETVLKDAKLTKLKVNTNSILASNVYKRKLRTKRSTEKQFLKSVVECPICTKGITRGNILKHKKRCAEKITQKSKCAMCGEVFATSRQLTVHDQAAHTEFKTMYGGCKQDKGFLKCDMCGSKFIGMETFINHGFEVHNRKLDKRYIAFYCKVSMSYIILLRSMVFNSHILYHLKNKKTGMR